MIWKGREIQGMSFAERLRISRKEKGYSQETLAEALHVSRQTVTKWETGNAYPGIKTLLMLSVILEKDLDWLFHDDLLAVRAQNHQSLVEQGKEYGMRRGSSMGRVSKEFVDAVLSELQSPQEQRFARTGYGFIDRGRGWGSRVYTLYGAANAGKTAFALNIIYHVIRDGGSAALFDLSGSEKNAMKKLLGIASGVSTRKEKKEYSRAEKKRLLEAGEMMQGSLLYMERIYEDPVEKIHEKCIRMDFKPDLIVIDGADRLFSAKFTGDARGDACRVLQELQEMARSCGCPVLLLKGLAGDAVLTDLGSADGTDGVNGSVELEEMCGETWMIQQDDRPGSLFGINIDRTVLMRKLSGGGESCVIGKMVFDPETLRMTEIER